MFMLKSEYRERDYLVTPEENEKASNKLKDMVGELHEEKESNKRLQDEITRLKQQLSDMQTQNISLRNKNENLTERLARAEQVKTKEPEVQNEKNDERVPTEHKFCKTERTCDIKGGTNSGRDEKFYRRDTEK